MYEPGEAEDGIDQNRDAVTCSPAKRPEHLVIF